MNTTWDNAKLRMITIVGFLKSSLIPALLKLFLKHNCTNQSYSSQVYGVNRSISSPKLSKYPLPIGLHPEGCGTGQLHMTCPGPGNTCFTYSRHVVSIWYLVLILPYLTYRLLYHFTITTCATVSIDTPPYEGIHRNMRWHYHRSYNCG